MTLRQFTGLVQEMPVILKMETGDETSKKEVPLSGAAGFQAMKAMIPRGTRRR